ncbi:MAG: hypothetical protein J7496_08525 [Novosphingobium sp.]|nr:hypothetical protein [Novosphingobium sp.]
MVDTLTPLPDPPSRSTQSNTAFRAAMDAWLVAQQVLVTEWNTNVDDINAILSGVGALFSGTSTTSNTIAGTGTKSFTTQTGKAFYVGMPILVARTSAPTNTMSGVVSSYDSSTGALSIAVSASTGSGSSITDWTIGPNIGTSAYALLAGATFTGLVATVASASGGAGFRVPHGSAPSAPTNGDIWTTTAALFARINGTTRQIATLDGAETLTNKTFTGYTETPYTITDGAAFEINPANGTIQTITLGASRTPKATYMANGQSVLLGVDDGTAYTLTWTDTTFGASGVKWVDNTAPTLATSGLTWITLWKVGGQVYGMSPGATS